jgi:hypothetical protein
MVFDDDFDGGNGGSAWSVPGAVGDIVAPQPSGSSWDVFGTIGGLFDSAADVVGGWYELKTTKDLAEIERDQMRAAAQMSSLGSVDTTFGADYTPSAVQVGGVNYPMWSLLLAAVGVALTAYAVLRKG